MDQIDRLLSAFPAGSAGADPEQTTRNYLLAAKAWELVDVVAAIDALIAGHAPGVSPHFLPTSAALGGECRRQSGLRLREAALDRAISTPLPAPFEVHDPASRARVKAMVEKYVAEHVPENDNEWQWRMPLPPVGGRRAS